MSPTVDPGSVKGHAGWVAGSKTGPGNNHAVAHNLRKKAKNGVRQKMIYEPHDLKHTVSRFNLL